MRNRMLFLPLMMSSFLSACSAIPALDSPATRAVIASTPIPKQVKVSIAQRVQVHLTGDRTALQVSRERVVTQAARDAAKAVPGIEAAFLVAVASRESGFDPNARNPHSGAGGLFQFTDQTWMEVVRRHAAKHGHAALVQAIQVDSGTPVASITVRQQIMALRRIPSFSAIMTAEMLSDERSEAENALGRPAQDVDLYIIHAKGEGGGKAFLRGVAAGRNSHAYAGVAADLGRRRAQANVLLSDVN